MPLGPSVPHPKHPPAIAQGYLAEAEAIAKRRPSLAIAHAAVARLAAHVGKNVLRAKHLGLLAKALSRAGSRSTEKNKAGKSSGKKSNVARFPELFDHYARLGDVAMMRRFVAALPDKKSPLARRWRAEMQRHEGSYAAALKTVGKAKEADSMALRARLLADTGKLNDAIAAWTSLVEGQAATDPAAHNGLGVVYLRRGLVELAIQSFNKAIQRDGDNPTYRANLATAYGRLDKRNDALKHVFSALGKAPDDPLLRLQLAHLSAPKAAASTPGSKSKHKPRAVAVMPLTTHGSDVERAGLGELVAAMLITAISTKKAATVVERERMDDILAEQKLQRSRYVDRKTAVRVGKLIGAQRLVTGNVAEFKGVLRLDLRALSVKSGKVLKTAQATVPLDPGKIDKALQSAVMRLLK